MPRAFGKGRAVNVKQPKDLKAPAVVAGSTRTTVGGDTRTTVGGDTRVPVT